MLNSTNENHSLTQKNAVIHHSNLLAMKLPRTYTLKEISQLAGCTFRGDENHEITGINEIHMVEPGDIVFVDHPKYYDKALSSKATTIIINKEVEPPAGKALIISEDPFSVFNFLTKNFMPDQTWTDAKAQIHPAAIVAPGVVLGRNVSIGAHSVIHPNVVIYDNTTIGERVIIHANTVIGGHAFYYKKRPTAAYEKMHSCGAVLIEDDVEIGCGCSIDKGVSGTTRIGAGTKIDNHVHIGHDTQVGKNCLFAAQVGIAGCVVIEDGVTLWGQVGVRSDVILGAGCVVLAQSGVAKSLPGGKTYFGSPADESRDKLKEMANTRRLPDIFNEIELLKKSLG
jgi:UDP-3-O-[3-hydroxymyristoyl] glucosamine N-acyltransferase